MKDLKLDFLTDAAESEADMGSELKHQPYL